MSFKPHNSWAKTYNEGLNSAMTDPLGSSSAGKDESDLGSSWQNAVIVETTIVGILTIIAATEAAHVISIIGVLIVEAGTMASSTAERD